MEPGPGRRGEELREDAPGTRGTAELVTLSGRVSRQDRPPGGSIRVPTSWLLKARPGPEPGWGSSWWDRNPDRRWRLGLWLSWVGHHPGEQPGDFHL